MSEHTLILKKMKTELKDTVNYFIEINEDLLLLNNALGKEIEISSTGKIYCLSCGRTTKKSFAQGYCYPCFMNAPETEECVLHPELCRAHEGIARNMEYAAAHCLQDHIVYLALTSDIKVGVTRISQVPTRWIDQGAWKAVRLARTPDRYTAGMIEVELKKHMPDKTNWQKMLKNENVDLSLIDKKEYAKALIAEKYGKYIEENNEITVIDYPVAEYPKKVKSLDLDKTPVVKGKLRGIKGQYLMFEDNSVINIRKFGGYEVKLTIED